MVRSKTPDVSPAEDRRGDDPRSLVDHLLALVGSVGGKVGQLLTEDPLPPLRSRGLSTDEISAALKSLQARKSGGGGVKAE